LTVTKYAKKRKKKEKRVSTLKERIKEKAAL